MHLNFKPHSFFASHVHRKVKKQQEEKLTKLAGNQLFISQLTLNLFTNIILFISVFFLTYTSVNLIFRSVTLTSQLFVTTSTKSSTVIQGRNVFRTRLLHLIRTRKKCFVSDAFLMEDMPNDITQKSLQKWDFIRSNEWF